MAQMDFLAANYMCVLSDSVVRIETGSNFSHDY